MFGRFMKVAVPLVLVFAVALSPVVSGASTVFGFKGSSGELEIAKQLVADFNKAHPQTPAEILDLTFEGNWPTKLAVLFAGGTPPDVIRMEYQRGFPYMADGLVQPLDPFIAKDSEFRLQDFFPVAIEAHSYGGEVYALPQEAQPFTWFVNTTLLDQAGFAFPGLNWTVDEMIGMARRSTRDSSGAGTPQVYGLQFDQAFQKIDPWLMVFGTRLLNEDRTKSQLGGPEALRALQVLADAATVYRVRGGKFTDGSVVFYSMGGPWSVPGYRAKIQGWDWDILPMPQGPGGRGTTLGSDGYYMARGTASPEVAWSFIKHMTSVASLSKMMEEGGILPSRVALVRNLVTKKPQLPPLNLPAYMVGTEIMRPTQMYKDFFKVEPTFNQVMNRVWNGGISLLEGVNQLLPSLNAALQQ